MRRASLERPRTLRVWRAHSRLIHEGVTTGCICDEQPGRFRKGQRAAGCSNPRCWLCKSGKLGNDLKAREYRAALSYREQAGGFGFFVATPRKP